MYAPPEIKIKWVLSLSSHEAPAPAPTLTRCLSSRRTQELSAAGHEL
jgi:hypothetical protein